jgi:radical SAM superfamily enzyme YgiQ (UPF0313 family)
MKARFITPYYGVKGYRVLTLPCLAAEFEQYCDVEINDQNVEPLDTSDADLVGITCFIYNLPFAARIAETFRERGIPVIFGGSAAAVMPPELLLPHCDAVCVGEVEGLGKEIIEDVRNGTLKKIYKAPAPPDLSHTRLPRVDLLSDEYPKSAYPVEASRGCPNDCAFCVSGYVQPGFRTRSLSDIERDVAHRDCGIVELVDLNFAVDKTHILDVCRIMENDGVEAWFGETGLTTVDDDEVLEALARSGCTSVYIGLESISEKSLATINKKFNRVEDYERILRKVQSYGIIVNCGLVIGLDGEDKSIFERTLEFMERNRIGMTTPTFVTYLPGTKAYERYKAEGRIFTEDWFDYSGVTPIMAPDQMTMDELMDGYEWFVKKFFGLRSILKRSRQPALSLRFGRQAFSRQFTNYLMYNYVYRYWFGWYIGRDRSGRSMFRDKDLAVENVQIPFQEHFKGLRFLTRMLGGLSLKTN